MIHRNNLMDSYHEFLEDKIPGSKLFNIALSYENKGLYEEAMRVYSDSMESGNTYAAVNLGVLMSSNGRMNSMTAAGLFLWAAGKGHSSGYVNLAQMYLKNILPGGNERAAEYYLKAAEMGNGRAQCSYAIMCKEGKGVKKSMSEAIIWFQKSAENGYFRAQAILGDMYRTGEGVYKDIDTAVGWYLKASDNGSPVAAYNLATMYLEGKEVERNEEFGRRMLNRAVDLGYSKAAFEAGMIAEGENDYVTAVALYSEGARKGEPNCIKKLYDFGYYDRIEKITSVSLDTDYGQNRSVF
jgi:hypothetical protein